MKFLPNVQVSDALRARVQEVADRDQRPASFAARELLDVATAQRLGVEPLGRGAHEDIADDSAVARAYLAKLQRAYESDDWDGRAPNELAAERLNVDTAVIDRNGDVWNGTAWLATDQLELLATFLAEEMAS